MVKINFVQPDGSVQQLDLEIGTSVMEGAVRNCVPGIDADCGGNLACATCHVHIQSDWFARLPPMGPDEKALLEFSDGVDEMSRLCCQIKISPEMDGLEVHVPEARR